MDWSSWLRSGETVHWEGRPAPRCFTFRNWRQSLFGVFLLVLAVYWQIVGIELAREYQLPLVAWIPLPVLLAALYLSIGHLLLNRMEWEKVFYAVTDRRILVLKGLSRQRLFDLPLDRVTYFQLRPHGAELGTLRISGGPSSAPLVLHCLEHPRQVADLLEAALRANGGLAAGEIV